jgi:hypothetical protein
VDTTPQLEVVNISPEVKSVSAPASKPFPLALVVAATGGLLAAIVGVLFLRRGGAVR